MDLPVYELTCEGFEPDEQAAIAIVDDPAIQQNFLMFKAAQQFNFSVTDEEQRIITGPVMIPDLPIFRNQPLKPGGPDEKFYVFANRETVLNTYKKFARNNALNKVNMMHRDEATPQDVFLFESWISDSAKGKSNPIGFDTLPDGTWFMSFICDNDAVWQAAKDGKLNGFSIQGSWGMKQVQQFADEVENDEQFMDSVIDVLQKIIDKGATAI